MSKISTYPLHSTMNFCNGGQNFAIPLFLELKCNSRFNVRILMFYFVTAIKLIKKKKLSFTSGIIFENGTEGFTFCKFCLNIPTDSMSNLRNFDGLGSKSVGYTPLRFLPGPEVPPWLDLIMPPVLPHLLSCCNFLVWYHQCHYYYYCCSDAVIASATISCSLWWSSFTRKYLVSISFINCGPI